MTDQKNAHAGALTALAQPFVDRRELAGAVMLVANAEGVLCLETAGYADIAAGRPMQPDTLFWIASQTKPITATALMMLVDEGRVDVEAPVAEYLPEFAELWVIEEQETDRQVLTSLEDADHCPPITDAYQWLAFLHVI